jgi:uncharacterized hydrophobic protein (TIGR00271 family)
MLHRPSGDAAGYWLQLLSAAALATLGLALDSTAVVIGAMLIAPLMRPIVELAMGLATGSAPLVFRTGLRSIASIVVVVVASAAFTALLPFHEPTRELLARTAPSLLDLFVAAACALAGAYAVVMTSSEVATTAAGTSIGISLVPPLCTIGYGASVGDWDMAQGAALLFTANVTGIVTVAGVVFVLTGFGQVDVRAEEHGLDADQDVGAATRLGRKFSKRASARLGPLPRVLLPIAMLGAISFPLYRAVEEMTQRSAMRQRVREVLEGDHGHRIVQYSLDQTVRPTALRVVIVGDPTTARSLEHDLQTKLESVERHPVRIAVWAVPDASAFSALSARLDDIPIEVTPPVPPPPPTPPLQTRVAALWPAQAGPIVKVWLSEAEPSRVRVTHLGPELGPAGREVLSRALALDGSRPVVEEQGLVPVVGDIGEEAGWLPTSLQLIERARDVDVHLCVTMPDPPAPRTRKRERPESALVRETLQRALEGREKTTISVGPQWSVSPSVTPCVAVADEEPSAGAVSR